MGRKQIGLRRIFMKKWMKYGLMGFLVVSFWGTGVALADDQDRPRTRLPKKDGSCKFYSLDNGAGLTLAGDRTRSRTQTRDRKKDGSCQEFGVDDSSNLLLAADKIQKRDRKKDGSCQEFGVDDGSCKG
jgi:hypothetical protein